MKQLGIRLLISAVVWLSSGAAFAQHRVVPGRRPPVGETAQERLRLRAGRFEIIPYLRLGQAGLDTNVFYTPEDRRTDLYATGGPGLQLGLPVRRVRFYVDGNLNYYWFARSKQERHFGGEAGGGFDWTASKFALGASRFYTRSYDRPSIEVDRRVLSEQWRNEAYLTLEAGARLRLAPRFRSERNEVPSVTEFLGTDLRRTLTQDRNTVGLEARLRLTAKTDFLLFGDQEWNRFPRDASRNFDSNLAAAGFALSSATRLSANVIAGAQFFRPKEASRGDRFRRPYVEGSLAWRFGDKTRLGASYLYVTTLSAFETNESRLPIYESQRIGASFFRLFGERVEWVLGGQLEKLGNDVGVIVRRRAGEQIIIRKDRFYSASTDLSYRLWRRFRLGVMATYNERQSNFFDFGVDGLLLGASVRFNP